MSRMEIGSIKHKALRRFIETGQAKGLPGDADRIARMVSYLLAAPSPEMFQFPPNFGAHLLTGNRAGVWALTVTKNWRMTFIVTATLVIENLDLEDYH